MGAKATQHDTRVSTPHLHKQFTAVTRTGRVIPLGKVVSHNTDLPFPHYCVWHDEHGKHYEWFNLDTKHEFQKFQFIEEVLNEEA